MNKAIPDALVTGHDTLINGLTLPDPDDRHVLAAAIRCGASVIVTFNERDFPAAYLRSYGVEARHPDEFIDHLFALDQASVATAAGRQRSALKNPPIDVDRYLEVLLKQGLLKTVKELSSLKAVLRGA